MERINKPKVFLSHSSLDKSFIERLAHDLRKCHVEYWLDTEEIRDGRSWLKVIFEDGIPTCDAVIVYLTGNSVKSRMVEKELDVAVVEQLTSGGITLLPYVSHASLRDGLRADIRTLHCREWNEANYTDLLPTVVAEIWRSYLERTVETARLQERNRRLELELELKQLREQYESSVFSAREEQEFQFLLARLDKGVEIALGIYEGNAVVGTVKLSASFLHLVLQLIRSGYIYYHTDNLQEILAPFVRDGLKVPEHPNAGVSYGAGLDESLALQFSTELLTYGLVELTRIQVYEHSEVRNKFTDKMYRFKYWLDYKNLAPEGTMNHVIHAPDSDAST